MSHTKKNNCKESVCEFNDNVDMTESLKWSLLEKRIGDDLNTLETALSSGLSKCGDRVAPRRLIERTSDPTLLTPKT